MSFLGDGFRDELRAIIREELAPLLLRLEAKQREVSPTYLRQADAARQLGVSFKSLARMIAAGAPSVGSGRLRRVRVTDVADWMRSRQEMDLDRQADQLLERARRGSAR